MNKIERKKNLINRLKNKEYRDAFVSEHIDTGIPFQIKALRNQRQWTQQDLAKHTGMKQARISKLEDPNYSRFTLATLKKLSSAFDVGLVVRYVPISELVEWELNLSPESLKAASFDQDPYFKDEAPKSSLAVSSSIQSVPISSADTIDTEALPAYHDNISYLSQCANSEGRSLYV